MIKMPKKANWAQKLTSPKKGKLELARLRKVLTTDGVQTFAARGWSLASRQRRTALRWLVQSGASSG